MVRRQSKPQPAHPAGKVLVVCATGASGARLTRRFFLHALGHKGVGQVHFVSSGAFETVLKSEENLSLRGFLSGLPEREKLLLHDEMELAAPVASGSYPTDATVIIPASMATLGAIASGAGRNLCHRAADVALKEGRRLILVPRETPLSLIHLKNMVALKEAGAEIFPFVPAFYEKPSSIDDLLDHFLMRILDHIGLETAISGRWS